MIILIFDKGKTSSHIAQIQNIQTWNKIPTTYLIAESSKNYIGVHHWII